MYYSGEKANWTQSLNEWVRDDGGGWWVDGWKKLKLEWNGFCGMTKRENYNNKQAEWANEWTSGRKNWKRLSIKINLLNWYTRQKLFPAYPNIN